VIAAWGVTLLETAGALALAAGFLTRPVALLFLRDMLGAIGFAVFPTGFVGGYELEFLLAAASLTLALAGAGAFSVDARLAARRS
jgi:putative oxidoreductase